jgi:methylated-DNA-protein-cysteine methyltransferase related protein
MIFGFSPNLHFSFCIFQCNEAVFLNRSIEKELFIFGPLALLRHSKDRDSSGSTSYEKIYRVIRKIPCGKVATYGQIARLVDRCTARMVGYALAALPRGLDVPWQRVINFKGEISPRVRGDGARRQRRLLEAEGIRFDTRGRVNLGEYRWKGSRGRPRALRR